MLLLIELIWLLHERLCRSLRYRWLNEASKSVLVLFAQKGCGFKWLREWGWVAQAIGVPDNTAAVKAPCTDRDLYLADTSRELLSLQQYPAVLELFSQFSMPFAIQWIRGETFQFRQSNLFAKAQLTDWQTFILRCSCCNDQVHASLKSEISVALLLLFCCWN